MANASMDYLNAPAGTELDASSYGSVLASLGEIEAKFTGPVLHSHSPPTTRAA